MTIDQDLEARANSGDMHAQYEMGCQWIESGRPHAVTVATWWYELAANQGHVEAATCLGVIHQRLAARHDHAAAVRWYSRAVEAGFASGQHDSYAAHCLALAYARGLGGLAVNPVEASIWLSVAIHIAKHKKDKRRHRRMRAAVEQATMTEASISIARGQAYGVIQALTRRGSANAGGFPSPRLGMNELVSRERE